MANEGRQTPEGQWPHGRRYFHGQGRRAWYVKQGSDPFIYSDVNGDRMLNSPSILMKRSRTGPATSYSAAIVMTMNSSL